MQVFAIILLYAISIFLMSKNATTKSSIGISKNLNQNLKRAPASTTAMTSSFGFSVPCEPEEIIENNLCINVELPQAPSIRRFLGKAGHNEVFPTTIPISGISNRHEIDQGTKYKILPYHRSSLDARLYLGSSINWTNYPITQPKFIPNANVHQPIITYFDPELIEQDHVVKTNPFVNTTLVHPFIIHNFKEGQTNAPFNSYIKNQSPATYHLDFCHDKYFETGYNPRACKAYLNDEQLESEILRGDCYDVTIFSFSAWDGYKNEIRTNPVTIFVARAKSHGQVEDLAVYPRSDKIEILPSFESMRNFANIGNPNNTQSSNIKELTDHCYAQHPKLAPYYCRFLYGQKRITSILVNGVEKTYPDGPAMFEPSISADGKLLIVNMGLGRGLHYSYNATGLCNADGWKNFYPISNMPFDRNITLNYPIGKSQLRTFSVLGKKYQIPMPFLDAMGNPISKNDPVEGAYLWVDRKVRNVFFNAVNVVQDQFKGIPNQNCNDADCMLDAAPGKGLHALGAWTKGKMIHLDSVVNMFDFGYRDSKEISEKKVFQMNLYKDEVTTLRPSAMTIVGSQENMLNFYDALSPSSPFDVVWNLNANNERTGEIIFDDYLNSALFFGTHFTQASAPYSYNGGKITLFKNGYMPTKSYLSGDAFTKSEFKRLEIPLLQNISTNNPTQDGSTTSQYIEVLGGARVEPLAQGGVHGKGLYLDGKNDSASVEVKVNKAASSYLLSLWIDPRTLDEKERTIFAFPDYSSIALTQNDLVGKRCSQNKCIKKFMSIKNVSIKTNKYFHLAVKVTNSIGANNTKMRRLSFYINGTHLKNTTYYSGLPYEKSFLDFTVISETNPGFDFYFNGAKGIFSVGKHNLLASEVSFHGWIDELRVYKFSDSAIPIMYDEVLCNLAYGSLIKILRTDLNNDNLKHLYNTAIRMNHFPSVQKSISTKYKVNPDFKKVVSLPQSTLICEQLKLASYNSGGDFADQRNTKELICADRVHKNPHSVHAQRCQRSIIYDVHNKPLRAGQPRPSFENVPFCLSCHDNRNSLLSLKKDALIALPINRELDHRRQPLNVPQIMTGCLPESDSFEDFNSGEPCTGNTFYLDYIFDFKPKI